MSKNKFQQSKISFRQKIILVLVSLFLFFMFLEVSLRLGGLILLSIQEHRNMQSIKQKGAYCILCLGESTTQGQYPQFLEEALSQRNIGVRFSVVDKGRGGANTQTILSQVELYIDECHPDMVVTMMGCNDNGIMYYQDILESDTWLFRHCRVYRFSRIIYMHILKKLKKEGIYGLNRLDSGRKAKLENASSVAEKINLSNEELIEKVTKLNSKGDKKSPGLRSPYLSRSKSPEIEESLRKAIDLNPKNDNAYAKLGGLYRYDGQFSQSEDSFKKAIDLNPKNDNAYVGLGWLYRGQGKFSQSEDSFKKAIELNPKNNNAYFELGGLYLDYGKFPEAEDSFKKAIGLNPKNYNAYFELGRLYRGQGKFSQSEDSFKKAIELNPKNYNACRAILELCEETGKPKLAKEYAEKANKLSLGYCKPVTVNSYRKLKEILDKKGIRLVCVQYPMRSIQPLKKIFKEDEDVVFVDNERIFKDAVRKEGYNEYFRDMFGGDFGHCTQKGNRLLAGNIANVIFKEVFGK